MVLVERPIASLIVHSDEGFCIKFAVHKRADMLVCDTCDTLVSVRCITNTTAHLLFVLMEIMPAAQDAIYTGILQTAFQGMGAMATWSHHLTWLKCH